MDVIEKFEFFSLIFPKYPGLSLGFEREMIFHLTEDISGRADPTTGPRLCSQLMTLPEK